MAACYLTLHTPAAGAFADSFLETRVMKGEEPVGQMGRFVPVRRDIEQKCVKLAVTVETT